jgi:hypothetical protein
MLTCLLSGTAVFANGDKFDGTYDMDRRHGFGVYAWKDGRIYEGEFYRDQRQGCGYVIRLQCVAGSCTNLYLFLRPTFVRSRILCLVEGGVLRGTIHHHHSRHRLLVDLALLFSNCHYCLSTCCVVVTNCAADDDYDCFCTRLKLPR